MFVKVNDNDYLICRKLQPSLADYLSDIGVRTDSFGATVFTKIYESFYTNTVELQARYQKYYSEEYESFAEFLKKKQRYDNETIQSILKCIDDGMDVYVIQDNNIQYSIEHLLEEELSWVLDVIKGYSDED